MDDILHELWLYIEQIKIQRIIDYKFCYSKIFFLFKLKCVNIMGMKYLKSI